MIGLSEIFRLFQNGDPGQARLVDLQDQTLEKQIIVMEGKSILGIVVHPVVGIFRMRDAVVAVGGHNAIDFIRLKA
jgi:hypothetical protein